MPYVGVAATSGFQANTISQPITTYKIVESWRKRLTKNTLNTVPKIASPQTIPNRVHPSAPLTAMNKNGVYVPAMKK